MDNNLTPKTDLEKYMQQNLQNAEPIPDDDLWANIAAAQSAANARLRFRYYGLRVGIPVIVCLLFICGWPQYQRMDNDIAQPNSLIIQQLATITTPVDGPPNLPYEKTKPATSKSRPSFSNQPKGVQPTIVSFLAEEGIYYQQPATGTSIAIPANSLVHADGSPVRGKVELELREYRNRADFIASGVPMHYNDPSSSYFFNSGGMFDVQVNQEGEELVMAPGQEYEVNFTSTHALTQASLYYYDEKTKAWQYEPNAVFDPAGEFPTKPPVVTESTAIRDNQGRRGSPLSSCLPTIMTMPADEQEGTAWISEAVRTGYDLAFRKINMPLWFRRNSDWKMEQLVSAQERGLVRLVRRHDTQDMFFPEDLENHFTELKAFKDCYFICKTDSINWRTPNEGDLNSYWDRVSVVKERGVDTYYVSFYSDQRGLVQFYAKLIASDGNTTFDAEKVMTEYQRLRVERRRTIEEQARKWAHFMSVAPAMQTTQEWCMTSDDWLDYFHANLPLMQQRYADLVQQGLIDNPSAARAYWINWRARMLRLRLPTGNRNKVLAGLQYVLKVAKFGLRNCDQIFMLAENEQLMKAYYKTADGQPIIPMAASVTEYSSKLFLTLNKPDQLIYIPGRKFDVLVVDAAGRYYWLHARDYAKLHLDKSRVNTIVLEEITDRVQTPAGWLDVLEI